MNVKDQAHQFALHSTDLEIIIKQRVIESKDLVHRIVNILRLNIDDKLILFNENRNALIQITEITKKNITLNVLKEEKNKAFKTKIICILPALKRNNIEDALYNLTEVGINEIQFISTKKSLKEDIYKTDRLKSIIISAAEQSKNFSLPLLKNVITFDEFLKERSKSTAPKVFFDAEGEKAFEVFEKIKEQNAKEIVLMVGPEGDLTQEEKNKLKDLRFIFCKLTPTILRASSAITIGAAIFRSLLD